MEWLRHLLPHFVLGVWPKGAWISSALWAIGIELGDLVKFIEDPVKHPEGFSWVDLFWRLVGAALAYLVIFLRGKWQQGWKLTNK